MSYKKPFAYLLLSYEAFRNQKTKLSILESKQNIILISRLNVHYLQKIIISLVPQQCKPQQEANGWIVHFERGCYRCLQH